jgi:FkbM family methyltransferase
MASSTVASLLYRLAKANRNFRHPLRLLGQRALARRVVTVADRRSALHFLCQRGADRMFGEVFHSRVYDIPSAPVRMGDWVIDVGANHGFATCHFASQGARVVSFEPHPAIYRLLTTNIAANGLASQVEAHCVAVAARDGRALLSISRELGGGMSTIHEGFARGVGIHVEETVDVEVTSLTSVLDRLAAPSIRLLKLDCEGSELEILQSLSPAARRRIDSIAIEVHPPACALADVVDLILGWGDFHLSQAMTTDWKNSNLHLVSDRALTEWAEHEGRP